MIVRRQDHALNLNLILEIVREQRPNRPVDHSARQDFLGGGPSLALEPTAGDLPGGVLILPVLHVQREVVDIARRRGGQDGRQHNRIAVLRPYRTVTLSSYVAGLQDERLPGDLSFNSNCFHCVSVPSSAAACSHISSNACLLRRLSGAPVCGNCSRNGGRRHNLDQAYLGCSVTC